MFVAFAFWTCFSALQSSARLLSDWGSVVDPNHLRQAYADYTDMMALTEDLIRACALEVAGTLQLTYQGAQMDLEQPFRRATMHELVQEATGAPLRPRALETLQRTHQGMQLDLEQPFRRATMHELVQEATDAP